MKQMTTPFNWTDDFHFREAPLLDTSEHLKTFAIFSLSNVLAEFGVGAFESDSVIRWFYQTAPTWPRKSTQIEFNKYARERVSDRVGYTRRRADACTIVDRLFDKAATLGATFDEVMDAITLLAKPEELPASMIDERGTETFVDLTKRADSPKVIRMDTEFLQVLRRLCPFEREDDVVIKCIPIGTIIREYPLRKLAFWCQHRDTSKAELDSLIARNGDPLDWRRVNLSSRQIERQEQAAVEAAGVPEEPAEGVGAGGRTFLLR
jgi:hypothetical protein